MPVLPPINPTPATLVEWATDSNAEIADPGASLKADGYVIGDAPASSHMNYLLHAGLGWSSFLAKVLQHNVAWGNFSYETGHGGVQHPFGTASNVHHVKFIDGRWYALRVRTGGGLETDVFDSEDGETWNYSTNVTGTSATSNDVSSIYVGGGRLAFASENRLVYSTDTTVDNLLPAVVTPWDECITAREMCYSPVTGYWFVAGTDGVDGKIDRATSIDGVWVTEDTTAGDEFRSIACSPSGTLFATTDNDVTNRKSVDGGFTWTAGPSSLSVNFIAKVKWVDSLDCFLMRTSAGEIFYMLDDGNFTIVDTNLSSGTVREFPNFVLLNNTSSNESFALFRTSGTNLDYFLLGEETFAAAENWDLGEIVGSEGFLMYSYGTDNQRIISFYGPSQKDDI
jgi:hypothetical protein